MPVNAYRPSPRRAPPSVLTASYNRSALNGIDCQPTWTPLGVEQCLQVEALEELQQLANEGLSGRSLLGERFVALSMHPAVSRTDIARATGLSEAEVADIIQERLGRRRYCVARAAEDRLARHLPRCLARSY